MLLFAYRKRKLTLALTKPHVDFKMASCVTGNKEWGLVTVQCKGMLRYLALLVGSLSVVAAKRADCFHNNNFDPDAPCSFDNNPWMIMFGAIQLV